MAFPALKISHRVYFTVLFLLFGAIIALFTSIINYNLDVRNIRKELDTRAADELAGKRIELSVFTERLEGYVASLRNSPLLPAYIRRPDPEHRKIVNQLFSAISISNPSLMQVRFLQHPEIPEQAFGFAETIRLAIEALAIEHRWGCEGGVITASFGLLCIAPAPGITVDTIYRKADQALYTAKQQGRNRIFFERLNCPAQADS